MHKENIYDEISTWLSIGKVGSNDKETDNIGKDEI